MGITPIFLLSKTRRRSGKFMQFTTILQWSNDKTSRVANPTFHVRKQNPSVCWGFAHRSSPIRIRLEYKICERLPNHISLSLLLKSTYHAPCHQPHAPFLAPNADFLIRSISPTSSFVNAKHFLPKSLSDTPIRYSSLSSTIKNRS